MQIYSPFKDYYDSLLSLGQDPLVTYRRTETTVSAYPTTEYGTNHYDLRIPAEVVNFGLQVGVLSNRRQEYTLIGFCGTLYLAYQPQPDYIKRFQRFYYSVDGIEKAFPKLKKPSVKEVARYGNLDQRYPWLGLTDKGLPLVAYERLRRLNEVNLDEVFRDKVQAPIFLLTYREYTVNPHLNPLQFYRAVDAPTAFQTLEAYLSNIFLGQYPVPAPLTEREQVDRYGFDPKYGFRTRPKK